MAFTLQDARDISYGIIKQPEAASAYPLALMDTFIRKAQNDICFGNVTNLQTLEKIAKVTLPFLNANVFYGSCQRSTVSSCVAGSTTLDASTTNFLPSGWLYIRGNKIKYTGVTGTQFTGIPATGDGSIQFGFEGGTPILQLYELPTDFAQPVKCTYNKNQRLVNIDQRDIISETGTSSFLTRFFRDDFSTDYSNMEYYYSVIDARFLLFIIPSVSGRMLDFEYQKTTGALLLGTDTLTIPDEYSLSTIPYLAVSEMMYNRGESEEGIRLNAFGFVNVINMYKFYQSQKQELKFNQRVRTSKDFLYPNV